jgi:hypothetical protein
MPQVSGEEIVFWVILVGIVGFVLGAVTVIIVILPLMIRRGGHVDSIGKHGYTEKTTEREGSSDGMG